MKIEVITMHRILNYGSILQALAFQRFLEAHGYEVEFLDYYPPRYHALGMLRSIRYKVNGAFRVWLARIILLPSYAKRFYRFRTFMRRYLHTSPRTYRDADELASDYPPADIYCTGSDQVWNSVWSEGLDTSFYLDFLQRDEPRLAYAASIGRTDIDAEEKERVLPFLKRYRWISVRERTAVELLSRMGIGAEEVADPVFLLSHEQWRPFISDRFRNRKYILVYNLNRETLVDNVAQCARKAMNLPLYYVGYNFHESYKGNRYYCCPKVEDFLSMIENAELVIGDSFHISAFSILFRREFLSVCPGRFADRIECLLRKTGLEQRLIEPDAPLDFARVERLLSEKINYQDAEPAIRTMVERSKERLLYELERALGTTET